jgi:predicted SprT family Zn-dependent metalloprotease
MNPDHARTLALALMQQHGLQGWAFAFDGARRRLGSCHYGQRTLTLSRPLTLLNPEATIRDTILHEIAHALTPGAGHGPAWREAARRIGAKPQACADARDVTLPEAPYALVCDGCGTETPRYRRPRSRYVCRLCLERHRAGTAPAPLTLRVVARYPARR